MSAKESSDATNSPKTVGKTLWELLTDPGNKLVRNWNWKAATLSAIVRGSLWFAANVKHGLAAAAGAMSVESAFYALIAGFYGALTQSFRRAEPPWLATMTLMVLLPCLNHTFEFLLHRANGTKSIRAGVIASITLSLLSSMFNLFVMRRGALIVGQEQQSLLADLQRMPRLVLEFLLSAPRMLFRPERRN